jgi:hypothetical protein
MIVIASFGRLPIAFPVPVIASFGRLPIAFPVPVTRIAHGGQRNVAQKRESWVTYCVGPVAARRRDFVRHRDTRHAPSAMTIAPAALTRAALNRPPG